jgi:hypothetical protein
MKSLRFNVFGTQVVVLASEHGWTTFYVGPEGKRRPATDIVVPKGMPESDIEQYLDDLCHEWASEEYPGVRRLD